MIRLNVPGSDQSLAWRVCLVYPVILVCAVTLMGVRSASAAPSEEEVRSWLLSELEQARAVPVLGKVRVTLHRELHWYPLGAEWDRLEAEIKGHPDHPQAGEFEHYLLRRAGKPTLSTQYIWIRDTQSFRRSEDHNSPTAPPGSISDVCVTPTNAFNLIPLSIIIQDPSLTGRQAQANNQQFQIVKRTIRTIAFGGLHMPGCANVAIDSVSVMPDGAWAAEMSCPSAKKDLVSYRYRAQGRWGVPEGGHLEAGQVEKISIIGCPDPQSIGLEYRTQGWRYFEPLKRPIATRVEYYRANGQLDEAFHLIDLKVEDDAYFQSLFRNPLNYKDAFRTDVEFTWFHDYQSDPNGKVVEIVKSSNLTTPVPAGPARESGWMTAWIVASAGVLVVLGGLAFTRFVFLKRVSL